MRWHPRVTVAAVIVDQSGRHLLVEERPDEQLVLNQPAGHLEDGESLLEAVVREVREETCREFSPSALLGVYRWRTPTKADTFLRFCFIGGASEELPGLVRDPDILGTHWVHPEALGQHGLPARSPLVSECMRDAAEGERYPLALFRDLKAQDV